MLRIDRTAVDRLGKATAVDEVLPLVADAMRLEFATIPPYLTAMLSLKPGTNRDIWWAIHDVVVDEMLHLLIAGNLLNALGGRPDFLHTRFVPTYPDGLAVGDRRSPGGQAGGFLPGAGRARVHGDRGAGGPPGLPWPGRGSARRGRRVRHDRRAVSYTHLTLPTN